MTWQDVLQSVIYPFLVLTIPALGTWAVIELKGMAATAQAAADAAALTSALNRGHALAVAQGTPAAQVPAAVAQYLATTSPDLGKSTGVLQPSEHLPGQLVPTQAGSVRIAASIAPPPAVEGQKP
jgi:hypothetical protein